MTLLSQRIAAWIRDYAQQHHIRGLVVGISGGIDSSVVSTLCAMTKLPTTVVSMPIRTQGNTHDLSMAHGAWLVQRWSNVTHRVIELDPVFDVLESTLRDYASPLALANSRSRLRMITLYQIAQTQGDIVVGTGNRVEDFGVGFFTKYGDGGVDISPIGDLLKTRVWNLGRELGILEDIITAAPTDGLWDDGRTDRDQLGMTYEDLEVAMQLDEDMQAANTTWNLSEQLQRNLDRYREIRGRNLHKMQPIPVYRYEQ